MFYRAMCLLMKRLFGSLFWSNSSAMLWGTLEILKSRNIAKDILVIIHALLRFCLFPTLLFSLSKCFFNVCQCKPGEQGDSPTPLSPGPDVWESLRSDKDCWRESWLQVAGPGSTEMLWQDSSGSSVSQSCTWHLCPGQPSDYSCVIQGVSKETTSVFMLWVSPKSGYSFYIRNPQCPE